MLGPKVSVTGNRSIPHNSLFTGSQGSRIKAVTLEDLRTEYVTTHDDLEFFQDRGHLLVSMREDHRKRHDRFLWVHLTKILVLNCNEIQVVSFKECIKTS